LDVTALGWEMQEVKKVETEPERADAFPPVHGGKDESKEDRTEVRRGLTFPFSFFFFSFFLFFFFFFSFSHCVVLVGEGRKKFAGPNS
jgi:hypothetical protein